MSTWYASYHDSEPEAIAPATIAADESCTSVNGPVGITDSHDVKFVMVSSPVRDEPCIALSMDSHCAELANDALDMVADEGFSVRRTAAAMYLPAVG